MGMAAIKIFFLPILNNSIELLNCPAANWLRRVCPIPSAEAGCGREIGVPAEHKATKSQQAATAKKAAAVAGRVTVPTSQREGRPSIP